MRWATIERLRTIGWVVVTLLVLVGLVVLLARVLQHGSVPMRRAEQTITQIQLPPPPPPPPPPPRPPEEPQKVPEVQPKEQTQTPQKPSAKAPPSKSPAAPPGNPLTSSLGPGNDAFGLSAGSGGGDTVGGGNGGGDGFGYYDGVATSRVREALAQNEKTRYGTYSADVMVWLDGAGTVTRAQVMSTTGTAPPVGDIVAALIGTPMGEGPPDGYPNPRHMRARVQGRS